MNEASSKRHAYLADRRGKVIPDGSWPPGREAPASLERVRRFLNTRNPESDADLLTTAAELREWLMVEGFRATRASRAEVASVRELRASLHVLVVANANRSTDDGALRSLTLLAAQRPVRFSFSSSPSATSPVSSRSSATSSATVAPSCRGVDAVIATILSIVASAMADATWPRLKACGHCGWVVYDRTKNQSVSWCAEEACGSRSRARSYRARHRGE